MSNNTNNYQNKKNSREKVKMEINAELDEEFRKRIISILVNLNNGLYERSDIVNLSFLSAFL